MSFTRAIEQVDSIQELCSLVEGAVGDVVGVVNEEVSVHFAHLGMRQHSFVGALYSPYFNVIVVNNEPIRKLLEREPGLLKSYLFHIILHEYVHSVGIYNEEKTRYLTALVCAKLFGRDHTVTKLATGELNPFRITHVSVFDMIEEELKRFIFQEWPDFLDE